MISKATSFLPFHVPLIEQDDIRAVIEVLESRWLTTGPKAARFEQDFARFVGARHGVAVNSCTAGLHVALEAIEIREDDEVIVPTLTFAATAEAVLYFKARPVLVDCEPDTFNVDPVLVERAVTSRTRAIVPVHFAGQPCDMTRLSLIARKHSLKIIEDAAHALPARYRGKMVGTVGDMTCFSFYATKNITTGEGGMVTTENESWADRMRIMRLHGISKDAWKRYSNEGTWKYEILAPGFKYNLTDMQAALGLTQLAKCQSMWARRCELAQRYTDAFLSLDAFEVPTVRSDVQHAWHLYVLRVCPGVLSIHRDQLIEELKQRGIGSSVHFIPLHTHPYYRKTWRYRRGDFPVAEDYFDRCISLPLYPAMSDNDQQRVIDAILEIARLYWRSSGPIRVVSRDDPEQQFGRDLANHPAVPSSVVVANSTHAEPRAGVYRRFGKRVLDLTGAAFGLVMTFPLLAICAAAVWLSSPGPLLFRQQRVGQCGRPFELLKFRTMIRGSDGPRITAAGDQRVTRAGRWLRRWKLDELPQLINVLKGEMALVGPRPEVAEYVATYTPQQRSVLQAKPGITSPASLFYVHEEEILARYSEHEDFYVRVLLPHKLEIDRAYCRCTSLAVDLKILLATATHLLPGGSASGASALEILSMVPSAEAETRGS